ncbi:hypothetical protein QIS99_26200, partial [Streptomyces sp. B-S-A8]|nr:hypothetical protein [Streptomyces sp. B-S-A8]
MSYDDPDNPSPAFATPAHRPRRRRGLIAVAALVPLGLAGWLLWSGLSGSGGTGKGPAPARQDPSAPASSPTESTDRDGSAGSDETAGTGESGATTETGATG